MTTEIKNGVTYVYPDTNKKLKSKNRDNTYSVIILAKDDNIDNYEEVDILWEPDLPNRSSDEDYNDFIDVADIQPDIEGKLRYEDAHNLIRAVKEIQSRIISLQENNNDLTDRITSLEYK